MAGFRGCTLLGFDHGVLTCNDDCTWNTEDCSGTERCDDVLDNDGDGDVDCADSDCTDSCVDPCLDPPRLGENVSVVGTTVGRKVFTTATCSDPAGGGPDFVYEIVAERKGKLDITLNSSLGHVLSVRSSCNTTESELACWLPTRMTFDVKKGEVFYAVVSGYSAADEGEFNLQVVQRQQACGDGIRDAADEPGPEGQHAEECDDENIVDGDGCDENCQLEAGDVEPGNNALHGAQPHKPGDVLFAQIRPKEDKDYYSIAIHLPESTLVVNTYNLGDGACIRNLQDTVIDVFDPSEDPPRLLVSADDGGDGLCARAVVPHLRPGTYAVRVRAGEAAQPATFPYRIAVSVGVCGDGTATLGEECDDGNTTDGDGCSAQCTGEP